MHQCNRSIAPMNAISSTPGARRLLFVSIVARLPLTMLSIGLLVHTEHLTGSFAAAGIVAGAYAVSLGVGGPLLGALVDRRGQTAVLVWSACGGRRSLVALAVVLPAGTPLPVLVSLALALPVSRRRRWARASRALFPDLLEDADDVRAAYAIEASAVELTWIAGPPLALGLGVLWSTGGALAVAGLVLLVGTAAFAAQPVSRAWRPRPMQRRATAAPCARRRFARWWSPWSPSGPCSARSRWRSRPPPRRAGARRRPARCSASGARARSSAVCSRPAPAAAPRAPPASRSCSVLSPPGTSRSSRGRQRARDGGGPAGCRRGDRPPTQASTRWSNGPRPTAP